MRMTKKMMTGNTEDEDDEDEDDDDALMVAARRLLCLSLSQALTLTRRLLYRSYLTSYNPPQRHSGRVCERHGGYKISHLASGRRKRALHNNQHQLTCFDARFRPLPYESAFSLHPNGYMYPRLHPKPPQKKPRRLQTRFVSTRSPIFRQSNVGIFATAWVTG